MTKHLTYHELKPAQRRKLEGVPLASIRARTGAMAVDLLFVLLLVIAIGLPGAWSDYRSGAAENLRIHFDPFHSLQGVVAMVAYFGLATWIGRGQTVGKKLFHIRVVSLTGASLTLWQCIERALGYGASALEAGFGFIQTVWYHNRQAVHDRIAETVVVEDVTRLKGKRQKLKTIGGKSG